MADDGELDTVKLISADGHEFVVDRKAAMVSGTIKSMLSGPGKYYVSRWKTERRVARECIANDNDIIQPCD